MRIVPSSVAQCLMSGYACRLSLLPALSRLLLLLLQLQLPRQPQR